MKKNQDGFYESCLTNLLELFEKVNKCVNEPIDMMYKDFYTTFDTVPHQRILKKNQQPSIRGQVLLLDYELAED